MWAARIDRAAGFTLGNVDTDKRESEELFGFAEKFFIAPLVDDVFEARFLAVGAIAVLGEDTDDGGGDGDRLIGAQEDSARS